MRPLLPYPLLILPPLPPNIPEPLPTLSLTPIRTKPAIQPQKRIRITLTQYGLALARVRALWLRPLTRQLARPCRGLNGPQGLCSGDDTSAEEQDGEEELEGYVGGEGGVREGGGVFVGGVDAG